MIFFTYVQPKKMSQSKEIKLNRKNLKLHETLSKMGEGQPTPPDFNSREECAGFMKALDPAFKDGVYPLVLSFDEDLQSMTTNSNVEKYSISPSNGENSPPVEITVHRPKLQSGKLPGVIYCHGGGMAILDGKEEIGQALLNTIAKDGCVVFTIHFSNSTVKPFPGGLNEICECVRWISKNSSELDIFPEITIFGESGGANLAISTAMKMKDEKIIKALYAICPFIFGDYGNASKTLKSWREFDGFFLNSHAAKHIGYMYTGTPSEKQEDKHNPLAWPYFADVSDVDGLCDTTIITCECDPLRDEGAKFFRTLQKAGVQSSHIQHGGLMHIQNLGDAKLCEQTAHDISQIAAQYSM
jgi:acetyl esterase/lipase